MENYIIINSDLLKHIFNSESSKLCGKCMKRFELTENKEEIKKQTKELIYEHYRDIYDIIVNCSKAKEPIHIEFKK